MTVLKRGEVEDALWDAGLFPEDCLREDYSGRGMYGDKCLGFVGDLRDLIRFVIMYVARCSEDENEDDTLWLSNIESDNMGLSTIWYWRDVSLSEEV